MYRLDFLPTAKRDMTEIVRYISHVLANPTAATRLAEELVKSAERLREFPYANAIHLTVLPLKHEYRKQHVQNYLMLYWVDEKQKCVTISRVMYARRDYENLPPFFSGVIDNARNNNGGNNNPHK